MPLVITDVSSFDEAGAQLVRLDAHFQTDCRARRARLHHVLASPRMRALKGMWRSVAAGEGEGLDVRPIWAQLVQRFRKILARKPRYPTTRASFLYSIAGCFSVAGRIPRSAHRPIRGRPTTRGFPVGYLGFRAKICLGGCTISDSHAIPIRKSNLPFRALAFPVYYRKRPLMAIALQFFVCLAISMLPRVSR